MGGRTPGQALKSPGLSAGRTLLPTAARPLAVTIVVICVLVMTVQGVWIRHGMETSWVDATVNAEVVAGLGGDPLPLALFVLPGGRGACAAVGAAPAPAGGFAGPVWWGRV